MAKTSKKIKVWKWILIVLAIVYVLGFIQAYSSYAYTNKYAQKICDGSAFQGETSNDYMILSCTQFDNILFRAAVYPLNLLNGNTCAAGFGVPDDYSATHSTANIQVYCNIMPNINSPFR